MGGEGCFDNGRLIFLPALSAGKRLQLPRRVTAHIHPAGDCAGCGDPGLRDKASRPGRPSRSLPPRILRGAEINNMPGEQSMSVTINTFPPLHTFTYSRSWFMAFIVLLHLGFFWVLTNGLSIGGLPIDHTTTFVPLPATPKPPPTPTAPSGPLIDSGIFVPHIEVPRFTTEEEPTAPQHVTNEPQTMPPPQTGGITEPEPAIVEPAIGRAGLSEPLYPSQVIRLGLTGTVLLAVQVLPNGRVGEVRLLQSSGVPLLDESAMREARRWRLVPGTRDGVPTTMWKQIPITFRLRN
jgi:protein TonB